MEFTFRAYRNMLQLLREIGYEFFGYHDYAEHPRCVILRHDIDNSPEKALALARLEAQQGVQATYFVLLRTDFYNPASRQCAQVLREILSLGHEIGLHFDEVAYGRELTQEQTVDCIRRESEMLSALLDTAVTSVSMHRPSQATLESDLQIPGMVNSYGKRFFREFKYLSDSRRHWREPVLDIIRSGEYDRLHILTHAFWYHEQERDISQTVKDYVCSANRERYGWMKENIRDLAEILKEDEI